ncbi:F-box protein At3g07870-like [Papaver somniferum]|uniref:F-box protein At3g07870-like n=1 Tax=Papaver somniferum TaxID=3469 RepID=UPI000E6F50A5|nr:F-box protein At3g07870-like [Papaver somniferum]
MSLRGIFRRFLSKKKKKPNIPPDNSEIMENKKKKPYILLVNSDIMVNILSRVPAESALACRQVCRAWRNLFTLDDKYFSDMHLRRLLMQQKQTCNRLSFIFLDVFYSLYYVDFDEKSRKKLTRINFSLPTETKRLVGSCNGLVCFGIPTKAIIPSCVDPVYICNLVTRECLELPKFLTEDEDIKVYKILSGFGYVPSSNEYKVVRIIEYYDGNERLNCKLQVYTLGAGSGWRDKGQFDHPLIIALRNVFVNGALHWLDWRGKIVAFGLAEEEFHVLATPPCLHGSSFGAIHRKFELQVLGESLCLFHQKRGRHADIWVLAKNTSYAKNEQHYEPWSWHRRYTLPLNFTLWHKWWHGRRGYPFAVTQRGEVLIATYNNEKDIVASSYDPKTTTLKKIENLKYTIVPDLNTESHVNSFVSLKALEEENVANAQKKAFTIPTAAASV